MRSAAWLAAPALALLLLAAHFVHAGLWPVATACLALTGLLAVPRAWAARVLQVTLGLGTIEWLLTAWALARIRVAHGMPYARLLAILGLVALFTALAALAFERPSVRSRFRRTPVTDDVRPPLQG